MGLLFLRDWITSIPLKVCSRPELRSEQEVTYGIGRIFSLVWPRTKITSIMGYQDVKTLRMGGKEIQWAMA